MRTRLGRTLLSAPEALVNRPNKRIASNEKSLFRLELCRMLILLPVFLDSKEPHHISFVTLRRAHLAFCIQDLLTFRTAIVNHYFAEACCRQSEFIEKFLFSIDAAPVPFINDFAYCQEFPCEGTLCQQ